MRRTYNSDDSVFQLPVGIAIFAADETLISWNVQAEMISGYPLEEMHTARADRFFHPSDVIRDLIKQAFQGVATSNQYLELRRADGESIPVSVQCTLQRCRDEHASQAVIIFRELMPVRECLRRDEHLQTLGSLASSFSHEIRNPLNSLFLHVDYLADVLSDSTLELRQQMEACVFDIKHETYRLDELTQNYLSLAGVTNLQCELTELSALVQTFAERLHPSLATRGITLHLEGLDQLGKAFINYNAFYRALLNLAHNAIDAMTFGGRLTLRGGRECSMIRLEVEDTGNGIPETQRSLLFTPFHTSKADGTGLGLFVAQQILTSHGGTLELTHSSERGTTFTLELPLAGTIVDDGRTNE